MEQLIIDLINPQGELESRIVQNDDFIAGCLYGVPRSGHPEGKVIYHIVEVLKNVKKNADCSTETDLRIVAILHDTFKYQVNHDFPRTGENNHGMIARRFAERYLDKKRVLETIELHDVAYNSWNMGNKRSDWNGAVQRARKLITRLDRDIDFYLKFYLCDNQTGNKSRDNYEWFKELTLKG